MSREIRRTTARRRGVRCVAAAGLGLLTACKGVLDVSLPGRVEASALDTPGTAATTVLGAVADFECAYGVFVVDTGLWSDEFIGSSGYGPVGQWDQRLSIAETGTASCPTAITRSGYETYLPLQTARVQAEGAHRRISGFTDAQVPNRSQLLATASAYSGYALTLLGEVYCSLALDGGPRMAPVAVLQLADQQFTTAIQEATAANDSLRLNLARVGRARVRMDLGRGADAAADAKLVPLNFTLNATYSNATPRRMNFTNLNNNVNWDVSVDPRFRDLTVGGVPDVRVPVKNMGRNGNDSFTPLWVQQKYSASDTPMPIATWDEAQLIIAEAEGGQSAVAAINRLRTKYKLPAYAGGTDAQIGAQVVEERRRQLFLQGHRLGDMLHFKLAFDVGANQRGAPYSTNTCVPLPQAESDGNPNLGS